MQPNRPLRRHEQVLGAIAVALLCGACADRLAIDLGRLGLGRGLRGAASAIGAIALVVALPYGIAQTLATVHFAAVLLAITVSVFVVDALFG